MPIWVAALLGGLLSFAASFVGRVLLALGVGFVAYTGLSTALSTLSGYVWSNFASLPSGVLPLLATLKVDVAIKMILSAYAARLVLAGLTSGTIKKMVLK